MIGLFDAILIGLWLKCSPLLKWAVQKHTMFHLYHSLVRLDLSVFAIVLVSLTLIFMAGNGRTLASARFRSYRNDANDATGRLNSTGAKNAGAKLEVMKRDIEANATQHGKLTMVTYLPMYTAKDNLFSQMIRWTTITRCNLSNIKTQLICLCFPVIDDFPIKKQMIPRLVVQPASR